MAGESGLVRGTDNKARCWWGAAPDDYLRYHDTEWGYPVTDDFRLFEKICLEGFQAGLSWLTILRKRERFREVFRGFNYHEVARFTKRDVDRLLKDAGIIRHRGKIEATINNAKQAIALEGEFGSLARYFWQFEPPAAERPRKLTREDLTAMAETPTSRALSKDLRRRGFRFVGPTTAYAFMQAMGLVNDHLTGCSVRNAAAKARKSLKIR